MSERETDTKPGTWLWEYSFCGQRFVTNKTPVLSNPNHPEWGWQSDYEGPVNTDVRPSPFPDPELTHPYCISRKGERVPPLWERIGLERPGATQ